MTPDTRIKMGLKIRVTVDCINEFDDSKVYSCCAVYSSRGNTIVQSEVDDHTKALASDALYVTHTILRSQIKEDEFAEDTIIKRTQE